MKTLARYTGVQKHKGVSMLFRIIYATTCFWVLTLFFWWGSYLLFDTNLVSTATSVGIIVSIITSILVFIREKDPLDKRPAIWFMIYLFYNVCFFGFFMGVPVFNIFIVVFVALYLAVTSVEKGIGEIGYVRLEKLYALMVTAVMFLVSFFSGTIALSDIYTPGNLTGMLGIYFDHDGVVLLILVGGVLLISASAILFICTSRIARRVLGVKG